jgi:hypothetical protein
MRFKAWHLYRFVLVGGTLVALGCTPSGAWAQQTGSSNQAQGSAQVQTQGQAQLQMSFRSDDWVAFNQFLDAHPDIAEALRANPDLIYDQNFMNQHSDLKNFCDNHPQIQQSATANHTRFRDWFTYRHQIAAMDQFLDQYPSLDQQLEANPSLIDDQTFLKNNPKLEAFLSSHPGMKQAFDQHPEFFMKAESRFAEGPGGSAVQTRVDVADFSGFLKGDPDIAKALEANPSLINDQAYVSAHPALQSYLNEHTAFAEQIKANPSAFMQMEAQYEATGRIGGYGQGYYGGGYPNSNGNHNSGEVASMDQFLSSHTEIAKQMEANPSLINNAKYLSEHPELRVFLNNNPQIREAFIQNPSMFLHGEQLQANANGSDVATMDAYLDKHHDEARDLNAYPARVNDSDYLAHHKDLADFLKKHPDVRNEFTHNPSAFMHQESSFDACAQMDDFLDNHKDVAKDLNSNPDNVKDAKFLARHKDLRDFLDRNPGVSDQVRDNPSAFIGREQRFEADRQMDAYLTSHKSVAKDLQKNPDQVKDANYLDHHKDLKQLLDKNPELAEAANTNPAGFWQEQVKFQQDYKNQQVQEKSKVQERATTHGAQ